MTVPTGAAPPVAFRGGEIEVELAIRTVPGESLGLTAKRDLGRYYAQLDIARGRAVKDVMLSTDELRLLVDIAKDKTWDASRPHMLWAEVANADRDLALERAVNLGNLERRLRLLSHFDLLSLLDALERYWLLPEEKRRNEDIGLRLVGLLG